MRDNIPADIDAEIDAIRADFQAKENAKDARRAEVYAKRQAAQMQKMRARLIAREWHPPCPCNSCWKAAYLADPTLVCKWEKDAANCGGGPRWWEP